MLLEKLVEYSQRLDLAPTMYQKMRIRWLIDLDSDGRVKGFVSQEGEGRRGRRGIERLAPHAQRTSAIRAKLLADNGEYVLGLPKNDGDAEKVAMRHEAFVAKVRACAKATQEPTVEAVLRFLKNLQPEALDIPEGLSPADNLTFRVDDVLPIELAQVRDYWARAVEPGSGLMQCLICGKERPPVKRLPFKIKGIPGGQTSGVVLISANRKAFESYGLEASLIAPTCHQCGECFVKAANALIENESTHITIGPLVYLFWTREQTEFAFASMLSNPEPDEVRELIRSTFSGQRAATAMDVIPFYATAFSASGGRLAVREWITTTLAEAQRHLARYFVLQRIVDWDGATNRYSGLYALAASTVRDVRQELPPNTPKALLRLALHGGPLPMSLLFQAVRRNRAEQRITRPRAALIKMVLLSQQPSIEKEDAMVQLDPENRNPAYLCGRLLAVLEAVQRAALPRINATITDRFFGTASSAPASVFGRLLRGAQPHLSTLRRDRPGLHHFWQRRIEGVLAGLERFPKTLTLEEQGVFALGYYHQRAYRPPQETESDDNERE